MSKHRRRRSRSSSIKSRKKRSAFRTAIETVMGVSIGLLILALVGWWFFLRTPPGTNNVETVDLSSQTGVEDSVADFKEIRDNGTLEQQKDLLDRLGAVPENAEPTVVMESLTRRLDLVQTILKNDTLEEADRIEMGKTAIGSAGMIYTISTEENLDSGGEIYLQLRDVCQKFTADKDVALQKMARLLETRALTAEQTKNFQNENVAEIQDSLTALIASYPEDQEVMELARQVYRSVRPINLESGVEIMKAIVTAYGDPHENVATQVRAISEELLLLDSGLAAIVAEAGRTKQYDKLLAKLGELSDNKDSGIAIVNQIFDFVSQFESLGKHDLAIQLLERLQSTAADRTDPAARLRATSVTELGLIRNRQVGKPFDFTDNDAEGRPLDVEKFQNVPVALVFYSPNDPASATVLQEVQAVYNQVKSTGVRFVLISVENPTGEDKKLAISNRRWDSVSSDFYKPSGIFRRCPVSSVPFYALVNKRGELAETNIPFDTLKTRIELIASEEAN